MSNAEIVSIPAPTELSIGQKNLLRSWVQMHGVKRGAIIARAYELTQESRSYLLGKGSVILTDGRETNLSSIKGKLLRYVLQGGAAAGVVKITGMKSKLREIEGFWQRHLGDDLPVAPVRPLSKPVACASSDQVERNCVVYVIKNTVTGRMYFGSTITVKTRWTRHRHELKQLSHSNYAMLEDARAHGVGSFKFFVASRFSTCKKMLEREQLLIAMYYNRDACYNLNSSVYREKAVVPVPVVLVDCNGEYSTHTFLTLHAAVRHYKLSKSAVRDAITAGHGRVGSVRFPINVSLTAYRTYLVGRRPPSFLKAPVNQPRARTKPLTYYDRVKRILDTQPIAFEELGRILSARTTTMCLWTTSNPPTYPQRGLLILIERFGIEWLRRVPAVEIRGEAINAFRIKQQLAWLELDDALGMHHGGTKKIAAQEIVKKKSERLLIAILLHYGLEPFLNIYGLPRSAFEIVGRFGLRW
jgi:hypothetical protein